MTTEKSDHLAPVLPVFKDWSAISLFKETFKTSEQLNSFLRKPIVLFDTASYQYPLGDGRVQNFSAGCWPRRWSYDGRSGRRTILPFVTNDDTVSLENAKDGNIFRSFHHIVNSFKYYMSKLRQSQKNPPDQNLETVPTTPPIQTKHLLRDGSKLVFLDSKPGRNIHQTRSWHRRWSFDDASQAKNRAIIEPPDQPPTTDTDSSSTQSPLPENRFLRFAVRCERQVTSLIVFLVVELGFPLAKLLCLPCRLKRRAEARIARRQCEKHKEIIRGVVERLEPAVEERGYGEMSLEFRMWEYAMTELDEREKAKYEFLPDMLSDWVKSFLRWRGYRSDLVMKRRVTMFSCHIFMNRSI